MGVMNKEAKLVRYTDRKVSFTVGIDGEARLPVKIVGKLQPGDQIDVEKGYVCRNGDPIHKVLYNIKDLGWAYDDFFVWMPGLTANRLGQMLSRLKNHWHQLVLPAGKKLRQKISEAGGIACTIKTLNKIDRMDSTSYLVKYKLEDEDAVVTSTEHGFKFDLTKRYNFALGKKYKRYVEWRCKIISWISTVEKIIINHIAVPALPLNSKPNSVHCITVGPKTFVFQANSIGVSGPSVYYAKASTPSQIAWSLVTTTDNFSALELGKL